MGTEQDERDPILLGLADPELTSEDLQDDAFLTEGQQRYLGLKHQDREGVIMHMNASDVSIGDRYMCSGHMMRFRRGGGRVRPGVFPHHMFSVVAAARVKGPGGCHNKSDFRGKKDAEMQALGTPAEGLCIQNVISEGNDPASIGCRDKCAWKSTMGGRTYHSGIYVNKKGTEREFWIVTNACHPDIAEYFHAWVQNRADKNPDGRVSVWNIYNSNTYRALRALAKRNAARMLYKTALVLGVEVDVVPDDMAYSDDSRREQTLMADPEIVNEYNLIVESQTEDDILMLLNDTMYFKTSSKTIMMGSPTSPLQLFDTSDRVKTNKKGRALMDTPGYYTAPVRLGFAMNPHACDECARGKKKRHGPSTIWIGKDMDEAPPAYLDSDYYKDLTPARKSMLNEKLCMPGSEDLHPVAVLYT